MRNSVIAALSVAALAALGISAIRFERTEFPPELHWNDRRPIASLVIATAAAGWPTNPRGWFLDSNVDVTNPTGIAAFEQRLLAWADRSIRIMRQVGAQGMITWDIEGEQFPHKTTYIGDPRLTDRLAPEMRGVADRYFQRFRDAGFRVGVTIRPQQFDPATRTQRALPNSAPLTVELLADKIRYAHRRWGATLFYVDSNTRDYLPIDPVILARAAETIPGILLIPEHSDFRYYGGTAPYGALRKGFTGTGAFAHFLYPAAFSVVDTADGPYTHLGHAAAEGDILLFRGWFPAPENDPVRQSVSRSISSSIRPAAPASGPPAPHARPGPDTRSPPPSAPSLE